MKLTELQFTYPEDLVALAPQHPSRVLWVDSQGHREVSYSHLLAQIPAGDVLVINNTKVLRRRIFAGELEILFLSEKAPSEWEVLFPAKKFNVGDQLALPGGLAMTLLEKGRPQKVRLSQEVDESYFRQYAELPLPPYIQKARGERHNVSEDENWYQTAWAKNEGSFAAPTASLHFSAADLAGLAKKGVQIIELTLHVGLGTFLPVSVEDLSQHIMHEEYYQIADKDWQSLQAARAAGGKLWALGTTAVRALESAARGERSGLTRILLQPGEEFFVVDRLLTNFHQPESTLLALVMGFAAQMQGGLGVESRGQSEIPLGRAKELVNSAYNFAIEQRFRLFSYGDLSVWIKN